MDVIDELIAYCEAWEPWARVMGKVCAGDAAQALRSLRAELAEWKATTPAPKPDCRTCAHVYTDMESYGCKRSTTIIVCIKGDGYVPSLPVRLYETGGE